MVRVALQGQQLHGQAVLEDLPFVMFPLLLQQED